MFTHTHTHTLTMFTCRQISLLSCLFLVYQIHALSQQIYVTAQTNV